jgi:predicted phosphodiesterase
MTVAALYDIHGNLPALEAVLREVDRLGVERIVVGGDVVPGPLQNEALECLLACSIPTVFIRGNGEREVLAERNGLESSVPERFRAILRWSANVLSCEHVTRISEWPETLTIEIPGPGDVLFCHATPRSDSEIFLRTTSEARVLPAFEGVKPGLVVCGHTHMQFDRKLGDWRVLNAGSIGMPYGRSEACWLLLGPNVELRQTPYDLVSAADRIRASSWPQADEFADREILSPMSEEAALELFGRVEMS